MIHNVIVSSIKDYLFILGPAWVVMAFFYGLVMGSFLNVVIYRYPLILQQRWQSECQNSITEEAAENTKINLLFPCSHCPDCQSAIRWFDNIPVLSWILLKGKCRTCDGAVSLRYPIIEFLSGLTFAFAAGVWGGSLWCLGVMALSALLIVLSVIDLDKMWLPDALTYPILWLGLGLAWMGENPISLRDALAGVIIGYTAFTALRFGASLLAGKEALGGGDVILFAALGAWVGPVKLIDVALIASSLGLVFTTFTGKIREQVPFGPWLALAGWMVVMMGSILGHSNFSIMLVRKFIKFLSSW